MVKKLYNKGFTEPAQLAIFLGMWGVGLVAGSAATLAVWHLATGQGIMNMTQDMLNPRYAGAVKLVQLVSTIFIFLLPAVLYALICYRNPWLALGVNGKPKMLPAIICLLVLLVCIPAISAITDLNRMIPLPQKTKEMFDAIEKSYEDQVKVIANVKSVGQYILSLVMIAFLPAIFEELLFRGGLQNMLSRFVRSSIVYIVILALLLIVARSIWFPQLISAWLFGGLLLVVILVLYRSPNISYWLNSVSTHYLVPIIFTSLLFSAVHGSWYGFLPRVALGIILGLVFYFTQNIFYNILLHFVNNAALVSFMFLRSRKNQTVDIDGDYSFPWYTGIVSMCLLAALFVWLAKTGSNQQPQEVITDSSNPFDEEFPGDNNGS